MGGGSTSRLQTDPARRVERRAYPRYKFRGDAFAARCGKKDVQIRLKDLSCGGASGLVEEPLAVGDYLLIAFDESHNIEAQVRWTRRVMVGLQFTNLLSTRYVEHLHGAAAKLPMVADDDWTRLARAS